jgi:hypothetical protein
MQGNYPVQANGGKDMYLASVLAEPLSASVQWCVLLGLLNCGLDQFVTREGLGA